MSRRDVRGAMMYITVFGAMLMIMIWEARSRYFFGYAPVILLLGGIYAAGMEEEIIRERKE